MRIVLCYTILLVCTTVFGLGCQSMQGTFKSSAPKEVTGSHTLERYRTKALSFEKEGEIQKAIYYWKIAGAMAPQEKDIEIKIIQLNGIAE